jgi:methylated-DNA-[protein]-cysteine S-methyltransferase
MVTRTLKFRLDRIDTPVGDMLIVQDEQERLRALDWTEYEERMYRLLDRYYGRGGVELVPGDGSGRVVDALKRYIAGELDAIDTLDVKTEGTDFQRCVWRKLREIPCGQTWSYGELARNIGKPRASRAVGMANGANPIGVVVPCHRVIGSNQTLTGYGSGLERKRWLLAHEGVIVEEPRQSALL